MSKTSDVYILSPSDEDASYSDNALFNITSWGADLSFRELIMMYDEGELIKPELQRKYIWTKEEASRFIESILLGLPVPSIFLAKVNEQKLIIDGYQRILTVYDYIKGTFSGDNSEFQLYNSKSINERWRGQVFLKLEEDEKKRIRSSTIHAIIFEQKRPQDDTGMYQIFERINTGGRTLKSQEIRNCVYQGKFNTLITNLNKYSSWRVLFGNPNEDSRMADVELVLRFFAIYDLYIRNEDSSPRIILKKYLNDYMNMMNKADDDVLKKYDTLFRKTMDLLKDLLGKNAFRNFSNVPNQKFASAFQTAIYDAISVATAYVVNNNIAIDRGKNLLNYYKKLLTNDIFQECVKLRTTDVNRIRTRIKLSLKYLYDVNSE